MKAQHVPLHVVKKTGHFLFPYLWHYFTDDYKDRLHHLVIDTLLSFFILGLLGCNIVIASWLYLFSITPVVSVTTTVPDLVISGESLTISAVLEPINKPITNVDVKVILPSSFSTSDSTTQHWDKLMPGKTETITVTGEFHGTVKQTYRTIILYSYQYYGQAFSEYATAEWSVDTSSLELTANTPTHILNHEEFTWTVDYFNSSHTDRHDVCVRLDIPDSFNVVNSSLPIVDQKIQFETIPQQSGGQVAITGSFSNAIGEGSHVIGVIGEDDCTNEALSQVTLQQPIEVLTPRLQLLTTGSTIANVGTPASYTVTAKNTGDVTLEQVTTIATLDNGEVYRWVDASLAPGTSSAHTFTRTISGTTRQKNLATSYTAKATAVIADIGVSTYTTPVAGQTKYNSTLTLEQVARYTSSGGEQLGYGPYPLQAWEITAERVFWQIEDFTNDLSNVTITTTLPAQVEWMGHASVSEGTAMTYDPATRRITWHSNSVPSFSHAQGANFEVRIHPNSDQVGKMINITNDVTFTAYDSFTGTTITRSLGALRTDQPIQPESK